MKRYTDLIVLSLFIFIMFPGFGFAQPNTLWTKTFGGSYIESAYSVIQSDDDGYIFTGSIRDSSGADSDLWIIKTDASGDTLWTKRYDKGGYESGIDLIQDSDGNYVVLGGSGSYDTFDFDIWLLKINSIGDTLWSESYGGDFNDGGSSIQKTDDLGYIIVGRTRSFAEVNQNLSDIWMLKLNSSGQMEWDQTYGGNSTDEGKSVCQTVDGGYIIVGTNYSFSGGQNGDIWLIKTDTNGDTLWTKIWGEGIYAGGNDIQQTQDDGFIITGHTTSSVDGSGDVWLLKTDTYGDTLWTKTYGGSSNDAGHSVKQTTDGGYFIVGQTQSFGDGSLDWWLIKTNEHGDLLWTKTMGGQSVDQAWSGQQTSDGGYIVVGSITPIGSNYNDVWLVKLNPDPPRIVINEIMQNPSAVSDNDGEWFEIINIDTVVIDLIGWNIKDNGTDSHTINQNLLIEPNEYLILGNNLTTATNGGVIVDYQYSAFTLGNSDDEIILIDLDGNVVDSVAYDGGITFPDPTGASMALLHPDIDNNHGASWNTSTTIFGDGDFGTPGAPNFISIIGTDQSQVIFDTTALGSFSIQILRIYNQGNENLNIDSIYTLTPYFQPAQSSEFVILPGDSANLDITFVPNIYGEYTDTLFILSNANENILLHVPLHGFGYMPVSHIGVNDTILSFPETMIGASTPMDLVIYNIGGDILVIDTIYITVPEFLPNISNTILAIGDSIECTVTFTPTDLEIYSGQLIIDSNDPDNPEILVSLNGSGITPAPDIAVYPDSIYFGKVVRGDTVSAEILIVNEGLLALEVAEATFPSPNTSPFWTNFTDASLGIGDSLTLSVFCSFDSAQSNQESSILAIFSNDPDEGTFDIFFEAQSWRIIEIPDHFSTIQEGIDAAEAEDSVLITPGTYTENILFDGKNVVVGSLYLWTLDTSYIAQTIIDGGGEYGGGTVVTFKNNVDTSCVLSGLTITNGYEVSSQGGPLGFAGGIDCIGSSPTLSNLIIRDNYVDGNGGGIQLSGSSPIIKSVVIKNNSGLSGGGGILCTGSSSPLLSDVRIIGNDGGNDGGGLYLTGGSSPILSNVLIANNTANNGGGLLCWDNNVLPILNNVTITNNIGNGIDIIAFAQPTLTNSIILGNTPANIPIGSTVIADHCDIEGGWDGEGNIDADPLFCDPANGDFSLAENSPCVGTGENGVDMGAFGIGCDSLSLTVNNVVNIPVEYALHQNYPNPFNPFTTISYQLPKSTFVNISMYNVSGQLVENLVSEYKIVGYHSVIWNASGVSSGLYFYRIKAGEYKETKKCLILK